MTAEPQVLPSETGSWLARIPAWVGDVVAIGVVLIASFLGKPMGGGRGGRGGHGPGPMLPPPETTAELIAPVLLVLVAAALIPLRRLWPLPVLAASVALYATAVVLDKPSLGIGIVVVIAAFNVGQRTTRLVTLIAGGLITTLLVVLSLVAKTFGVVDVPVFLIAAAVAVAAALGDSARSHHELVTAANERAERAEQTRDAEAQQRVAEERLRIAQDLHDTVAHQISVISLNAGVASSALDTDPAKAKQALGTIRNSSRDVLGEIGTLLNYLRTDTGPAAAPPQPGIDDVSGLIDRAREMGLDVTSDESGDLSRVTGATGRVVYRIVQEGLTNAHKHGSDARATVNIAVGRDDVVVTITNPVSRFAKNQPKAPQGGLGLTGIRERVASVGGNVTISSDNPFTVRARLPLKREDRA